MHINSKNLKDTVHYLTDFQSERNTGGCQERLAAWSLPVWVLFRVGTRKLSAVSDL